MGNGGIVRTHSENEVAKKYEFAPIGRRALEISIPTSDKYLKTLDTKTVFDQTRREALSMFIGGQLCMQNALIRDEFYKYITAYQWVGNLLDNDSNNSCFELQNNDISGSICFNQYCLSIRSGSMDTYDANIGMSKAQIIQQLKINDSKDADSFRFRRSVVTSISHQNLNSFVLAGLWPFFLESPQFIKISENIQAELEAATTAAKIDETNSFKICTELINNINAPASDSMDHSDEEERLLKLSHVNLVSATSSTSTCPTSPACRPCRSDGSA